jgi:poly(A) polymerase
MTGTPTLADAPPPHIDGEVLEAALAVARGLRDAGHEAFFAGGFARDTLLGRSVHDIDIATSAKPDEVQALFPVSRAIGKSFGVIQVMIGKRAFDVATFRQDRDYTDGRHPSTVAFTNAAGDAERRDFTVNGMFYEPATGQVIDYVGGLADLERKIIRCIGEPSARFAEDHLRLLRALRFAAVLDFTIEEDTWSAIREHAAAIASVSMERIREEMTRMFMESPSPGKAFHALRDAGLLAIILPEAQAMHGVEQPPDFHPEGDVFTHTALMLDLMKERSPELIWSILMHDIAKPATHAILPDKKTGEPRITFRGHADVGARMAEDIMRRFKCSNHEIEAVVTAVKHHMRFADIPNMRESKLRRWVGSDNFPLELELHRIDCSASHHDLTLYDMVEAFREKLATEPVLPEPLLRGRDLIDAGIPPGPHLGQLLKEAYDAQLEGAFTDKESALAWLKKSQTEL